MGVVVIGENAAYQPLTMRVGEDWSQVITLQNADGSPWSWTGKTAKMTIKRAVGATAVKSLTSPAGSGLDISVAGQITIIVNLDGVPGQNASYDLWQVTTAGSLDRPLLYGPVIIVPSMTP